MKIQVDLFGEEIQNHVINRNKVFIGRSSQCDVVIIHESMSRKHCLVEIENGKIFVTDLESTNGVSIDGVRITPNEKTFYLNSLSLMIGGANVSIDLTDHQVQDPEAEEVEKKEIPESKTATRELKKLDKEMTSSLELDIKPVKPKTIKKPRPIENKDSAEKNKILIGVILILIFSLLALWYFSQNE